MQLAVLVIYLAALITPWLFVQHQHRTAYIMALVPAALTIWFATHIPMIAGGEVFIQEYQWIPGLDISLTMVLDGLSLMFALLICGIGTLIVLYAGAYLKGNPAQNRFLVILLAFMGSMLGLVLADNLITLFVFWELTSITSYMLIGFNHQSAEARKAALQGLIVTVAGGLALLCGLVMLASMAGSYSIQEILNTPETLTEHPLFVGMLICLLLGAFTKSAQFPFHFWLPNAMAAPTPVSAYLHSATMVKAGIYLLARLQPELGESGLWTVLLSSFGAMTMLTGAFMAVRSTDLKKLLAYSTIMALGTLTLLIGIGTETAMIAFAAYLLAHSLYKGALFMLAGIVDHEAGSRDVTLLGGLRKNLPLTAILVAVAALSLAGIPPLFGFVAKELLLEAMLDGAFHSFIFVFVMVASIFVVTVASVIALRPFFGAFKAPKAEKDIHEPPKAMLAGPIVLVLLSLVAGVIPGTVGNWVTLPASNAVAGNVVDGYLALWHGLNLPLLLSGISITLGLLLFKYWDTFRNRLKVLDPIIARGPERGYFWFMDAIVWVAEWQTHILQNGSMRNYLRTIVLVFVGLTGYTLISRYQLHWNWDVDLYFHEFITVGILVAAAIAACVTRSRLGSVAAMGAVGFSVALIFILFSAPDLGITQILVETLTVILLVLVLFRLPGFSNVSTTRERIRDAVVALLVGVLIMFLIMITIDVQLFEPISGYMIENSYTLAHGRNIVNVILVDYRALDTLGEIFVLALAAMGVYAMIKFNPATSPGANHYAGTLILEEKKLAEKDIIHSLEEIHQKMLEDQNIISVGAMNNRNSDEDGDEEQETLASSYDEDRDHDDSQAAKRLEDDERGKKDAAQSDEEGKKS
ncbi:NADH:ubiquinone oxidoreductase subunit 5 (chain L)/multisubunit Na+/H+ antiporter, MnhA subunit [Idiomarina sp. A28L]|uniref:putative monovalent cation/H+ antiporter subunit A n=1 Tax=Idiomarina sp. A28L TaxID=1036674 RepID=UPI0002138C7A|nr:putative monovalent cation/H+ antiporter subunit A [Idiomarina sp. A28L]EGN76006.1 NADH:ubiquinone oxidoreductase subunit 5 (chain L)/multisubunit Na+/H+ antiporter, MnhA subunit [Idiomarina sp. A28L]